MKRVNLQKLILENTGLHEHLEIDFGKVTVVQAKNARGKTTIENAIVALLEGKYKNLISNDAEEGKIFGQFSDNLSVLLPLKQNAKDTPQIIEDNQVLKKTRTVLGEWNPNSLRISDFFNGSGVELEKKQVETLLKIIKIELKPADITDICGEIPFPDRFTAMHPLDYVQFLVNEKDGYYYKERAANTAQIQTIQHSSESLRNSVLNVFNKYGISIDDFDPKPYIEKSLSEMSIELHKKQLANEKYQKAEDFIAVFEEELLKMESQRVEYLANKRNEFSKSYEAEIKAYEETLIKKLFDVACTSHNFDKVHSLDHAHDTLNKHFEILHSTINREYESLSELLKVKQESNFDNKLTEIDAKLQEKIDAFKQQKTEYEEYIASSEKYDIDVLLAETQKVEAIQKIIPIWTEYRRQIGEYEDRKDSSEYFTDVISKLRKLPKILLQRSEMPVRNLSFNDDGKFVFKNQHGKYVTLDQLSEWEQMQISYDVNIASMGKINLMIIPKWSEIDPDNQKATINYFIEKGVNLLAIGISNDEKIQIKTYNEVVK